MYQIFFFLMCTIFIYIVDWNIGHTLLYYKFSEKKPSPPKIQSNTSEVQEFKLFCSLTAWKVGFTPRKFCQANKILWLLRGYDTMFFIINFIWCPKQLPSEDWPIFTTENSASQAGQYKLSFIKPFNPKTIPFCLWKVDCFLKYIIMRPNALKFGISEKHTKFEKNLPYSLYIYLSNVQTRGRFSQMMCASQKVRTLWIFHETFLKLSLFGV